MFEVRIRLNLRSSSTRQVVKRPYLVHKRLFGITPPKERVLWRMMNNQIVIRSSKPLDWQQFDDWYPDFGERNHSKIHTTFRVGKQLAFNVLAYARGHQNLEGQWSPKDAEEYRDWIRNQGERLGFKVTEVGALKQEPYFVRMSSMDILLLPTELMGGLQITDVAAFEGALANGVGRMRGYGCGLLLVRYL